MAQVVAPVCGPEAAGGWACPAAASEASEGETERALSCDFGSSSSLSSMSRQSSMDLQTSTSKQCARQINMRLMQTHSPQEIFDIVEDNLHSLDSINVTAALQRLAKFLANDEQGWQPGHASRGAGGQSLKDSVLASPTFHSLARMLIEQCNCGFFNAQSTANAWWAVAKLHAAEHPASVQLVGALEHALIGCLSNSSDSMKPNAQAISSIWYSWGRIAADGYLPSAVTLAMMWERTNTLCLAFDSQGIANMLWAFGQLRKKHGEAFAVRTDVLTSLTFVVSRISPSFAVQGLSCSAIGCANMGPALRPNVLPLMQLLISESLRRFSQFNLQAMANMTSAVSRMGKSLAEAESTRVLLMAFDAHAATLPGPLKPQEAMTLCTAMRACGVNPTSFKPSGVAVPASAPSHPPRPHYFPGQHQYPQQRGLPPPPQPQHLQANSLRDATNSFPATAAAGASGWPQGGQLASLASLASLLQLAPAPTAQQHQRQQGQQYQACMPPPPPPPPTQQLGSMAPPTAPCTMPPAAHPMSSLLPGLAAAEPLSISQYSLLAQQLALGSGLAAAPPPVQHLAMVLPPSQLLPTPHLLHLSTAMPQGGWQQVQLPPPPPPPQPQPAAPVAASGLATAGATGASSTPANLQAILEVLHNLKLQADREKQSSPGAGCGASDISQGSLCVSR